MPTPTATTYSGTFPGRAEEISRVRRYVARHLANCPATQDAVLIASEFGTNAILFFLLSSGVATAAISGHADLRPGLFDHLLLAAACRGTTWDGQSQG